MAETNPNLLSRLSDYEYLHSNPDYFAGVVSNVQIIDTGPWFEDITAKLDELISDASQQEHSFYSAVGVSSTQEFEERYLSFDNIASGSINYVMTSIILDANFAERLREEYRNSLWSFLDSQNKAADVVSDTINLDTVLKQFRNESNRYQWLDGEKIKKDDLKKQIRDKISSDIRSDNNKIIKYLYAELKKRLGDTYQQKDADKAIEVFKESIDQSLDLSALASKSAATGFVLELALPFAMNEIGSGKWINIANEKTANGKKSGTDAIFRIVGSNGEAQEYRFQLKNSFTTADFGMIKIQDSLAYTTLIDRIEKFDEKTARLVNYLVGNIIYLRSNGLDVEGHANPLTSEQYAGPKELLKVVLNAAIGVFLGDAAVDFTPINNFFIYKGKYLIPVSAFFISAQQVLKNFKGKENPINANTLGMVQVPGIEQFSSSKMPASPRILQIDKRASFSNLSQYGDYYSKYPDNLMSVAGGLSEEVASGMNVKAFWYTWKISNIQKWVTDNRR